MSPLAQLHSSAHRIIRMQINVRMNKLEQRVSTLMMLSIFKISLVVIQSLRAIFLNYNEASLSQVNKRR
jgi:hypothetical protein